jgi:hypothetical protein
MRLIAASACALAFAARAHGKVAEFGGCYSSTTHSTTCAYNKTACGSDTWLTPSTLSGYGVSCDASDIDVGSW